MDLPRDPPLTNPNQTKTSHCCWSISDYIIAFKTKQKVAFRKTRLTGRRICSFKDGEETRICNSTKLSWEHIIIRKRRRRSILPKAPSRGPTPESPRKGAKRKKRGEKQANEAERGASPRGSARQGHSAASHSGGAGTIELGSIEPNEIL